MHWIRAASLSWWVIRPYLSYNFENAILSQLNFIILDFVFKLESSNQFYSFGFFPLKKALICRFYKHLLSPPLCLTISLYMLLPKMITHEKYRMINLGNQNWMRNKKLQNKRENKVVLNKILHLYCNKNLNELNTSLFSLIR